MKNKTEKSGGTGRLSSGRSKYNLSLYILIPFIFMGMSVLSGIIAFQLSKSYTLSEDFVLWSLIGVGLAFFVRSRNNGALAGTDAEVCKRS